MQERQDVIKAQTHRWDDGPTEARLAAIVQSSLDAIIGKGPDGTVTSWNPAATELFGWATEEMVGRSINVLIPSGRQQEEKDLLSRVANGERVNPYETKRLTKDGAAIHVALTASPIRNGRGEIEGIASIYRDIGWIKRREVLLQSLLEVAHDAIVGVDAEGTIQVVNTKAEELFGYEHEELIGQSVEILVPVDVRDIHAGARGPVANRATRPNASGLELTARHKDGTDFPVDISMSSQETEDGIIGVSVRDITEVIRAAQERERLEEQLGRTRLESIGQLVGGIAHDFNNLLAGIMGFSALAQEQLEELAGHEGGDAFRQVSKDVNQIILATERAATLTRQLLLFGRQDVTQPQTLDLNQILSGMEDLLRRSIGEDIRLVIDLAVPLGRVHMDPGHFEQTLMNLAVNARDAMPDGGELSMSTSEVVLDAATAAAEGVDPADYVVLTISDTGTGMPPEVINRAFEPYFTTKPRGEGSGLGLATVHGIVAQSGGHMAIRSLMGHGTTVDVYLPSVGLAAVGHSPPSGDADAGP